LPRRRKKRLTFFQEGLRLPNEPSKRGKKTANSSPSQTNELAKQTTGRKGKYIDGKKGRDGRFGRLFNGKRELRHEEKERLFSALVNGKGGASQEKGLGGQNYDNPGPHGDSGGKFLGEKKNQESQGRRRMDYP